jgi:hypothetical protein
LNQQFGSVVKIARRFGAAGQNLIELLKLVSANRLPLDVYPFGVILLPSEFCHVVRQSYYSAVQVGAIVFDPEPAAGKIIAGTLPYPNQSGFLEDAERVEELSSESHLLFVFWVVATSHKS